MADTKIEWCDKVWNPIAGCTKCSPGCLNCYAERMSSRLSYMGQEKYSYVVKARHIDEKRPWSNKIFCDKSVLHQPLHWRKPKRIFVCSMSDLFHEKVPFEFIDKVFGTMILSKAQTSRQDRDMFHKFLLLTKRPKIMLEYYKSLPWLRVSKYLDVQRYWQWGVGKAWYPENIHLGVSISNQAEADEKIPILLQIPAAVRWLSIEPMLGPIDLTRIWWETNGLGELHENFNAWVGINGVVVGGESGPGARPMHPDWARNIRDKCVAADVPFYFKQWGKWGIAEPIPNDPQKRFRIVGGSEPLSPNTIFKIFPEHELSTLPLTGWVKVGKKKAGCILDGKEWKQLPERR